MASSKRASSTTHAVRAARAAATGDAIDHPSYYGGDVPTEPIKVIEAWGLGFHLGSALKYISRAGKKDPAKEVEDLEKGLWYLQRHIENLKRGANAR